MCPKKKKRRISSAASHRTAQSTNGKNPELNWNQHWQCLSVSSAFIGHHAIKSNYNLLCFGYHIDWLATIVIASQTQTVGTSIELAHLVSIKTSSITDMNQWRQSGFYWSEHWTHWFVLNINTPMIFFYVLLIKRWCTEGGSVGKQRRTEAQRRKMVSSVHSVSSRYRCQQALCLCSVIWPKISQSQVLEAG